MSTNDADGGVVSTPVYPTTSSSGAADETGVTWAMMTLAETATCGGDADGCNVARNTYELEFIVAASTKPGHDAAYNHEATHTFVWEVEFRYVCYPAARLGPFDMGPPPDSRYETPKAVLEHPWRAIYSAVPSRT